MKIAAGINSNNFLYLYLYIHGEFTVRSKTPSEKIYKNIIAQVCTRWECCQTSVWKYCSVKGYGQNWMVQDEVSLLHLRRECDLDAPYCLKCQRKLLWLAPWTLKERRFLNKYFLYIAVGVALYSSALLFETCLQEVWVCACARAHGTKSFWTLLSSFCEYTVNILGYFTIDTAAFQRLTVANYIEFFTLIDTNFTLRSRQWWWWWLSYRSPLSSAFMFHIFLLST